MTMRNPLGSISALSMAATPSSLPVTGIAAGIGITVAASIFIYKEYKEYEEKKYKLKIEEINRLYKKYLSRIIIFDYGEIQGFPPIFKLPEHPGTKAESMHLTEEEIKDVGSTLPRGADIALSNYRQLVLSAILKLKEYYFSRPSKTDITAGVLSYLLYMLEKKCLNFAGYTYDIAYLDAITHFINAFASMKESENTQHFSRLQPVYSYLQSAKQSLEKHKESLSLEDMLSELRDSCEAYSNTMIRDLSKLVNKNKYWDLIPNVALDELSHGILRKKYIHTEVKSIVLTSDDEIKIKSSIFKKWIIDLTQYYMKTLNLENYSSPQKLLPPEQIFQVPDLKKIVSPEIKNEVKEIHDVFSISKNFITQKIDPNTLDKKPTFIPIKDNDELIERSKILANFASLIHKMISLLYLSTQLLQSVKQLGEIYVKDPNHFCCIFVILEGLCNQIQTHIESNINNLIAIEKDNHNIMQLETEQSFLGQVKDRLNSINATVTKLSTSIKDYRLKAMRNLISLELKTSSVKHDMFDVANLVANIYNIPVDTLKKSDLPENKNEHAPTLPTLAPVPPPKPMIRPLPAPAPLPMLPIVPLHLRDAPKPIPLPNLRDAPKSSIPLSTLSLTPIIELKPNDPINILNQVSMSLGKIYQRILVIKASDNSTREQLNTYQSLYQYLMDFARKSDLMSTEENITPERKIKATQLLELTLALCLQTQAFFQLDKDERKKNAVIFSQAIHKEINDNSNEIDKHYNKASKLAYSVCEISLFATDSRKKLSKIDNTFDKISKILSMA